MRKSILGVGFLRKRPHTEHTEKCSNEPCTHGRYQPWIFMLTYTGAKRFTVKEDIAKSVRDLAQSFANGVGAPVTIVEPTADGPKVLETIAPDPDAPKPPPPAEHAGHPPH